MSFCFARSALRAAPTRRVISKTSRPVSAAATPSHIPDEDESEFLVELLDEPFKDDDTVALGHLMLREQRQVLYYLRLIEHEMPKLVGELVCARLMLALLNLRAAYRKPFVPAPASPLVVRTIDYAGEEHPVTSKRVIVASVDDLPLKDKDAIHRIKVLAGPRWTPNPPADGGISGLEEWKNGYIKIACEDFPKPAMNLKWASDTMDKLVAHANVTRVLSITFTAHDIFQNPKHDLKDVPVDLRHVYAKARKAKKGEHTRGRVFARPSILDFPLEWIPERRRKYALSLK